MGERVRVCVRRFERNPLCSAPSLRAPNETLLLILRLQRVSFKIYYMHLTYVLAGASINCLCRGIESVALSFTGGKKPELCASADMLHSGAGHSQRAPTTGGAAKGDERKHRS